MADILPSKFFTHPGPSPHAATAELRAKCPVHRINIPPARAGVRGSREQGR